MDKRKSTNLWIVLLIALISLIAAGYFYWTRGVYISITNNTYSDLKGVNIAYEGGVIQIAVLEPQMSYGRHINPTHASGLILEWFDSSGKKHSHEVGVYFEPNPGGSIEITVDPSNIVLVTNKVRFMPWPL